MTPPEPAEKCCVCGSTKVVYHNYTELPFCWPCADGRRPGSVTLRPLAARSLAVALIALFIVGISLGAYYDAGGWLAVATVWGSVITLAGLARVLVWALDNWNAS